MPAPVRIAVSELLAATLSRMQQRQVRCALIGAGAFAAHGVAAETPSLDLLVVSAAVLDPAFWNGLAGVEAKVDAGAFAVRLARGGETVNVHVGRMAWHQDLLRRARPREVAGAEVPVASVVDLILLKLTAGTPEDVEDVRRLLAITDRESITEQVDGRLNQLPPECARLWRKALSG